MTLSGKLADIKKFKDLNLRKEKEAMDKREERIGESRYGVSGAMASKIKKLPKEKRRDWRDLLAHSQDLTWSYSQLSSFNLFFNYNYIVNQILQSNKRYWAE